ncbi:MAG: hypothetical protein E7313_08230 [Clostridiales bacterium]|nr:hypothetical protein [Clostridiales bacterium]
MSYEMCNRIAIKKKTNQLFLNVAANNVWPHTYSRCEYAAKGNYTLDEKLMFLMESMLEGNIQISQTNKNTIPYEYALLKVHEYYRENKINHFTDRYEKRGKVFEDRIKEYTKSDDYKEYMDFCRDNKELVNKIECEVVKELYNKEFEIFKNSINEKIEGKFYIANNYGEKIEFCSKTKYGFRFRKYDYLNENCIIDNYKLAYIRQDYMGENFKIEKVEEKQKELQYEEDTEEELY